MLDKKISFLLKLTILVVISILIFNLISNQQNSFQQTSTAVNIKNITLKTIDYLWNTQNPQNLLILLFFSVIILFLITHAIIIYQEGVENNHG